MGAAIPSIITGGLGLAGSAMSAGASQAQAAQSREKNLWDLYLTERGLAGGKKAGEMFMQDIEKTTPELAAYQEQMKQGLTPEIQEASKDIQTQLALSGVRGPQAAGILSRQVGSLRQAGERDIAKLALEDALRRQQSKQEFLGKQGRIEGDYIEPPGSYPIKIAKPATEEQKDETTKKQTSLFTRYPYGGFNSNKPMSFLGRQK